MIRPRITCKKLFLATVLSFLVIPLIGLNRYSVSSGNWNSTSTWSATSGGTPGASVPGKNDDVFIENGHMVFVTEDYDCSSVTFTGVSATLVINAPATLTLKTSITLNKQTSQNSQCYLTGSGTLLCVDVAVGSDVNPPPSNSSSSLYTHTFTSRIANLMLSVKGSPRNNVTVNSYTGGTSHFRNGIFDLEGGIVTVEGNVVTINATAGNNSTFSMATGSQSGTLNLTGRNLPFGLSATGTNTVNLNGAASLVNYSMSGTQTVLGTPYNNLTISGSGAKTVTDATVNGILSMEGSATASGSTPSFGPLATLQYKGSVAQTTGVEFPATFSGSGGVVIANPNNVTLNGSRSINAALTFANGKIITGTYKLTLASVAAVNGAGAEKYVYGNLEKGVAPGTTSRTFEIGDVSVYAPVVLDFNGTVSTEGFITASTTAGDHPNIALSTFIPVVTVNRFWTLTNNGVSGFISCDATFNFVPGDVDAGADYANFFVGNYVPATWIYPAVGTKAATSTQALGLVSFGDFQVGELPVGSFRTRQSGNWNLSSTWESFDGISWINATSTPTSASGFIYIRSTHTVINTVAVSADELIVDAGGRLNLTSAININDGSGIDLTVNGIIDCTNSIITGTGSFLLDNGAGIIIGSPEGITLTGATGNIQTNTRTFREWANYTYAGTAGQITGTGLPASVNNLTINNPAGVSLAGSITINGTLILSSGTLITGSNTLTMQNSDLPISRTSGTITTSAATNLAFGSITNTLGTSFAIPSGTFSSDPVINNLTIYRTNQLTLNDQVLSLSGVLLCNGPLDTNGNLTLLSGPSGTALIDGTSTGQVTNNVTMQRYLPSGFGYKYFSSPFVAATVGEFGDDMNLADPFPTFYRYDESRTTSGWVSYTSPAGILNPLEGYAVNFGSLSAPVTADVTGIVNDGLISLPLYNNNNTYTTGFNLVGNPYPSPVDWNDPVGWTKTNIDNALYYFRASSTDEYGGTYSTYINGVSSDGLATSLIPSMQGFFIHVTDGSFPVAGLLEVNDSARVKDLTHPFAKSARKSPQDLIRLEAGYADDQASSDFLAVYFDHQASEEFEKDLDALKMMNTDYNVPNLYSVSADGKLVSIKALPFSADSVFRVPLGLQTGRDGIINFSLAAKGSDFSEMPVYLTDETTGTENDLTGDKIYSVTLKADDYRERFWLNVPVIYTGIPELMPEKKQFSAYCSHGMVRLNVSGNLPGKGIFSIINTMGQLKFIRNIPSSGVYEFSTGLNEGIYIVTYSSGKFRGSGKIFIQCR